LIRRPQVTDGERSTGAGTNFFYIFFFEVLNLQKKAYQDLNGTVSRLSLIMEQSQKTLSTIVQHMFNPSTSEASAFATTESPTDTAGHGSTARSPGSSNQFESADESVARSPGVRSPAVRESVSNRYISQLGLANIYQGSCSRKNFSVNLVRRLFDEQTRKTSNVSGKGEKTPLNPDIMQYVRSVTMQFYPLQGFETEKKEWAACVVAIDESCRRLVNKPRKPILLGT